MEATQVTERTTHGNEATVERTSDRELVISRVVNGPARLVFEAWTTPELIGRWWVPKSIPMLSFVSCEMDVRVGGRYRVVLNYGDAPMEFFGRYLEVTRYSRLSWTNDEADHGETITTVTFEETDGRTRVAVHDRYPSKEALDEAMESGAALGMPESLAQLDDLVASLGASA
jgi:uncharacterized protein YndB with AHSA1/START domain